METGMKRYWIPLASRSCQTSKPLPCIALHPWEKSEASSPTHLPRSPKLLHPFILRPSPGNHPSPFAVEPQELEGGEDQPAGAWCARRRNATEDDVGFGIKESYAFIACYEGVYWGLCRI